MIAIKNIDEKSLHAIYYEESTHVLDVTFRGKTYRHYFIPPEEFKKLAESKDKTGYFIKNIKPYSNGRAWELGSREDLPLYHGNICKKFPWES